MNRVLDFSRPAALTGLLSCLVFGSALAVGGVQNGVVIFLGGLAIVAAGLAALEPPAKRRPSLVPVAVLIWLSAYCLLQTVPMPISWLHGLSPAGADIWSRALLPRGESVSYAPLSLDPSASTLEAVKWATYAVTFHVASRVARRSGGEVVFGIVFASAVAVALATVAHELVGARKVWGLYEPKSPLGFLRIGPFLNPNNLAGYLNLGALAGLGLLPSRRPAVSPWIVGAGIAIVVAVAFRSASRGGMVALVVGLLLTAGLIFVARFGRTQSATRRLPLWPAYATMGAAILFGLLVGTVGADRAFWNEFIAKNADKLQMSWWIKPLIQDYAAFGIGRGSFETAFLAYRPEVPAHQVFTHPENFIAQWLAEWGILAGGGSLLVLAWAFRPTNVGATKSALNAAGFSAVVVLLVQNLVDLGLELPGISVALAALLGALWGDLRVRRPVVTRSLRLEAALGWALAALCASATVLAAVRSRDSLQEERERARESVESVRGSSVQREAAWEEIRAGMLRHPADYYFPLLGAIASMEAGSPGVIPWVQRALERGPNVGRTHLVVAEVLARRGAVNQAMLELRLAVNYEPNLATVAGETAVRYTRDQELLMHAVADGRPGSWTLDAMAARLSLADLQLREALDREAIARDPAVVNPRERLARHRLESMRLPEGECDADCETEIREQAAELSRHHPRSSRGAQLLGMLAMNVGDSGGAYEILRDACSLPHDPEACLQLAAQVAPSEDLPDIVERYASLACTKRATCGSAWDWASRVYEGRTLLAQAHGAAKRAAEQEPSVARWVRAADLAERSRNPKATIDALEHAQRLAGEEGAALRRRILDLRGR